MCTITISLYAPRSELTIGIHTNRRGSALKHDFQAIRSLRKRVQNDQHQRGNAASQAYIAVGVERGVERSFVDDEAMVKPPKDLRAAMAKGVYSKSYRRSTESDSESESSDSTDSSSD